MQNLNKPAGHPTVIPYLIVPNPQALIDFAKVVFGASEKERHLDEKGEIRHAELQIDDSLIMLGGATDQWTAQPAGLFIYVPDADAAYHKALAAGASSVMPPADQEYGRSCGVTDSNKNTWWITSVK